MCRRWGGAFYGALTGEGFSIAGEDEITAYRSSEWAERAFCGTCGSNLWFKFLPTGNRSFHAGLFPDADSFEIEKEIFTDEKAGWGDMMGDHPRQTGEEVIAEAKAAGFTFD
ncbi:GFA family protein [Erythrobacter sp. GH3-10]|uniref:GFA family protein n=2 Tax=Aurantiacibacter rhizosphaerae TaxID=2691582 RepID=A0A844XI49_9SPHN|nr:GFA family protein [Aurantiacibacter rhizosphaerae]